MSTKQEVLKFLESKSEDYTSGQMIADNLNLSRTAVWKAIADLRKGGAIIKAVTNKGYRLIRHTPNLNIDGLKKALNNIEVHYFEEIDSTNNFCKQLAANNKKSDVLVITSCQKEGRGRRGRLFESPVGGIYFSLLLKPHNNSEDNLLITSAASVAISRAISKVCSLETQIKWVNDIYFKEKKVCGILTEGVIDMEAGAIGAIVLGMGINFSTLQSDFSEDLQDTVISLYNGKEDVPNDVNQTKLVVSIIEEIYKIWNNIDDLSFLDEYRKRSNVIGKNVNLFMNNKVVSGYVESINNQAHLLVTLDDTHEKIEIGTGEVTLRVNK